MTVKVKWNVIGCDILVEKGTRQGGLTSPMLFNLLYKDLIDGLANYDGGIAIGSMKYNVICYAGDILLVSLCSSGLQGLIDYAVSYVREHGLSFNSFKTKCCIIGKNPFSLPPKWYINGNELAVVEQLDYLGAALGNKGANTHIDNRIRSCRKAFCLLQNVGLCNNGLNVDTATYVFKATCLSILTNGCEAMKLTKKNRDDVDKLQARLLKCIAGLGPRYRSGPLLQAMGMHSASKIIDIKCIQLLCNIMKSDSAARSFYMMMLHLT